MRRLIPFMRPGKDAGKDTGMATALGPAGGADRPANLQPSERALEAGVTRPARKPSLRVLVTGALTAGLFATGVFAYAERSRLSTGFISASAEAGLRLQTIEVQGRAHTPKEVLIAASELTLGQPMLTISLPALHERLATIGWVREVAVERRMPSTIRLILTERVPMALLQTEAGHRVIDEHGDIISGADPAAFGHLTVVAGSSAAPNAAPLLNILRTEPELFAEVWAVTYQSERRWDVHLRNGIRVRLPETDPRTAWSRLAVIDHSKKIIDRDLAVIDMRVPDQMIVEPNIPVRGKGRET
ncbi:MAG: cell division protein FtsQ/DivIB [Pseudomonadota bacterium]|nr:cell division protein FtsQ/DivIB [Pseudomonadota bacterium]